MQVLVENGYITAYATIGSVKGGVEVEESTVPKEFFIDFDLGKYMFVDGKVVSNEDYKEATGVYSPSNTELMLAQTQMQVAEISYQIKGTYGVLNMYPMFETIKYSYGINCYTDEQIKRFVELGCITEDQYKEITDENYPVVNG